MTSENIQRYHALDAARASAMLLGVLYHALQFGGMMNGPPGAPGPGGPGGSSLSMRLQEWLHSFRMPLFFLIAGFFCAMMLSRYGTRRYLVRRWTRLGVPFVLMFITLVPLYLATRNIGPGTGGGPRRGSVGPVPGSSISAPRLPDGTRPPSKAERLGPDGGPGGPPGFGPPPGGPPFGRGASAFRVDYLWFIWYLLMFITISPAFAAAGRLIQRTRPGLGDELGGVAMQSGLAPLALGTVTGPALLLAPGMFGWSLGLASGIFRGFPEFLYTPEPDMPFYLAYFLAGWWLFSFRDRLGDVSRAWLPFMLVGLAAHAGAEALSATFSMRRELPSYGLLRMGGLVLYAIGSAYTAFGVLGMFLRYVDRPTRSGRYLADTAFWVYLVHLPLLMPILRAVAPLGLPWWLQAACASALTTAAALLLYELAVRPTPLMNLFGPVAPRGDVPRQQPGSPIIDRRGAVSALAD